MAVAKAGIIISHPITTWYIMESLLLMLFITHLTLTLLVGGELLQRSTDVVYVSDDGTDDSSCLNGDGHCKTLGYVLTNMPMLHCSNCTVMVTYDHVVGLFNKYLPYTVNISNIDVLYIVGLGQPNLFFNESSLILDIANTLSVIIDNIVVHDCGGTYNDCMNTGIIMADNNSVMFPYFLKHFSITNTSFYNSGTVTVSVINFFCQSIGFHKLHGLYIMLYGADTSVIILNSTFSETHDSIDIGYGSGAVNGSLHVLVQYCHFTETYDTAILFQFDALVHDFESVFSGSILISDNYIRSNQFTTGISFHIAGSVSYNRFKVKCIGNTFINNTGKILDFLNWPFIEIGNCAFINNTVALTDIDECIVHIQINECLTYVDVYGIIIYDSNFSKNEISTLATAQESAILIVEATIDLTYCPSLVSLSYLNFSKNQGTPLSLVGISVNVTGDIVFSENNAITGGGLYITDGNSDSFTTIFINHAVINFINNVATYGGAIYVDQSRCFVDDHYENGFIFVNNHATYGSAIYSSYDWCNANFNSAGCVALKTATNIASLPINVSFNNDTASVFPGQTIIGNMIVTDCLGKRSSCLADVFLWCNNEVCVDHALHGPSTIFLFNGSVNTGLSISTNFQFKFPYPQLIFICRSPTKGLNYIRIVNITLLNCLLGFIFSSAKGQCECAMDNNEFFICSQSAGVSCVREGYWYSNISHTISQCVNLFCDYSKQRSSCPSTVSADSANYLLLGSSQDDQCLDGHGGTLCTGCAHNKLPTYGALQCIDSDRCAKWHPYVLMLFNIMVPFCDGVFLIIIVRLKLSIGSGYLYGPWFYLAVLSLLPLTSYVLLNTVVSLFVATLLLQLKILGYIPWCFFSSVGLFTSKWFELIAPSVVAVVLLLTVYLARCSPKLVGHIQKSPLQAMCLLMCVLFWSLASTSISVMIPVHLSGVEGVRVHLEPDLAYLSGGHIPLWIVSVIILLVLYSAVFVLTCSRLFNLHRLKPILDEFQSCYKDSYRWYGGVYFTVWTILLVLLLTRNYRIFQTFLIVQTATHCLVQPYCKKWLNVMDGFFLGSLSVTACSVLGESSPYLSNSAVTTVLVYASVMMPLSVISLGIASIVLVRFGTLSKFGKFYHKLFSDLRTRFCRLQHYTRVPQSRPSDVTLTRSLRPYREPLIINCLYEGSSYDADSSESDSN